MQKSEDRKPIIDPANDWIRKLRTANRVFLDALPCHLNSTQFGIGWHLENTLDAGKVSVAAHRR
jgi:hypothetical protein